MPGKQRVILFLLAVAAAVVAIIVLPSLGGDDDSSDDTGAVVTQTYTGTTAGTTTTPETPVDLAAPTIVVRGGKPVGGVKRLTFKKGQTVRFVVKSDVADEIHVHGYDLTKDVPAGGRATMRFKAKSDGIYEVELETRAVQIAQLRISP